MQSVSLEECPRKGIVHFLKFHDTCMIMLKQCSAWKQKHHKGQEKEPPPLTTERWKGKRKKITP